MFGNAGAFKKNYEIVVSNLQVCGQPNGRRVEAGYDYCASFDTLGDARKYARKLDNMTGWKLNVFVASNKTGKICKH